MPKGAAEDLTGQRFGRWTVLSFSHSLKTSFGTKKVYNCRCDCGVERKVRSQCLKMPNPSCGCGRAEKASLQFKERNASLRIDLTGTNSGLLTYIEEADLQKQGKVARRRIKCSCACGQIVTIYAMDYINGHSKSCGCFQKQVIGQFAATKVIDLIGQRFGRLLVQSREPDKKRVSWNCLCDCGSTTVVQAHNLGKTKSCGCLSRELSSRRKKICDTN